MYLSTSHGVLVRRGTLSTRRCRYSDQPLADALLHAIETWDGIGLGDTFVEADRNFVETSECCAATSLIVFCAELCEAERDVCTD